MLDIGYHYLTGKVEKICAEANFPTELGFIHRASSRDGRPFVYDFMEWLRPITTDRTVRVLLNKKKRQPKSLTDRAIKMLISRIKKELQRKYYHPRLGYCITLEYWAKLIILNLRDAVNDNRYPKLYFPSLRHETRCNNSSVKTPI